MGPYCNYCDTRCFLPRVLRDGRSALLATCRSGMARDRAKLGEDHTTALNPVMDQDAVEKLRAELADLARIAADVAGEAKSRRRADDDPAYCGYCDHHADQHTYARDNSIPCTGCPQGVCQR